MSLYFPTVDDALDVNEQALAASGQSNHALLRPDVLESSLGRASNHYHYGEGDEDERIAKAAGALAHGVGAAQAFEDGNKRTAYWLAHHFLNENGYPHLAPEDDDELADHLIGHGEGTHSMEDTQNLFHSRHNNQSFSHVSATQARYTILIPTRDNLGHDLGDIATAAHHWLWQATGNEGSYIEGPKRGNWRDDPQEEFNHLVTVANDTPEMDSHIKQLAQEVAQGANQWGVFVTKEGKGGIQSWTIDNKNYKEGEPSEIGNLMSQNDQDRP